MKALLFGAALAVLTLALPAVAGTSCYQLGNTVYCTDSNGNSWSCYRLGNSTYCN
jgi:hypothetical protein